MDHDQKGTMYTNSETHILNSENGRKSRYFIYVLTVLSTVGSFLFGYDTGVVSGAMLLITEDFHLNNVWHEAIVSGAVGAALVFALVGGWMAGRFGRRPTILVASILFTLGSILMAAANSAVVLLVGRCIVGAGIGLSSMSIPVYIAECSPSKKRGVLVTTYQVVITFGLFASCVVCGLLAEVKEGWRYMLGLAAVPAALQFVGFLYMPESPRWLILKRRYDQAYTVLYSVHGSNDVVEHEMSTIRDACEEEERQAQENIKSGTSELLLLRISKSSSARKALVIGSFLMIFQQLAGINTVMYYSASIIRMSGVGSNSTAIWYATAVSAVNFVFSFVGMYLVERIGRRTLTLSSLLGVAISLILLGIGFTLTQKDTEIAVASYDPLCGKINTCGECVAASGCGFCFSSNTSSVNGFESSCWSMDIKSSIPLAGPCNSTQTNAGYQWASDWCPSEYFWVPIVAMCLYLVSFAPGIGPMPWTINSEIHPMWSRNFCTSITTSVNWAMNLIVSMTFLSLVETLGQTGTFFMYAGIAIVGYIVLWLVLPETRGFNLEEIHQLFSQSWFVFRHQQIHKNRRADDSDLTSRNPSYDNQSHLGNKMVVNFSNSDNELWPHRMIYEERRKAT